MAYQLLQREVESLRQQRRPAIIPEEPVRKEEKHDLTQLILNSRTAQQVIDQLRLDLDEKFSLNRSSIFMVAGGHPQPAVPDALHPGLAACIQHLDEQGILDWVFAQQSGMVIPNLLPGQDPLETHILLIPLYLRGAAMGIFAGLTSQDFFESGDIQYMTSLSESAMIAIDNIRSAEEIIRTNQRLALLNKQMLQSSKLASIGELAGSVAHEINNPLQILLAHLQLLESGVGNSERRMEIIKQQVYRINEITRRLLDFARSSPSDVVLEPVEINNLIDEVLLFVNSQLSRDGIQVVKELEIPSPQIKASRAHLEQVFLNLFLNARDAMPDGGTLTIGAFTMAPGKVLISVADTGTGISEENMARIFDPFFTTKATGKGTGLGLSITRSIIQQHHGDISVISDIGKGTTFKITLPLARPL
jgi:signal transduction histidine kinase